MDGGILDDTQFSQSERDCIGEAVARFRRQQAENIAPRIEVYLAEIPERLRGHLFHELLCVQIAYTQQRGELLDFEEYCQRFPDYERRISEVFMSSGIEIGNGEGTPPKSSEERSNTASVTDPSEETVVRARQRAPKLASQDARCHTGSSCDEIKAPKADSEPPTEPLSAATIEDDEVTLVFSDGGEGGNAARQLPLVNKTAVPKPNSIPGYVILGLLGRGGMGVVYRAKDERLKRIVALKMIVGAGHGEPELITRFRNEAETVAKLTHPNIVQVFETGEHSSMPYVTFEYIAGGDLNDAIQNLQSPQMAAATVRDLARGIACAHAQGIIHRDLKPANVLLPIPVAIRLIRRVVRMPVRQRACETATMERHTGCRRLAIQPRFERPGQCQRSRTLAWQDISTLKVNTPRRATFWGRPVTWRQNKHRARLEKSGHWLMFIRWEPSCMRC